MKNRSRARLLVLALLLPLLSWAQSPSEPSALTFEAFEAKLAAASPRPQILDARSPDEFRRNHLKGAIQVNVVEDTQLAAQISQLDKLKPVFVYSINNGRSNTLAKKLNALDFREVYVLPGGISQWIGAGRPVESAVGDGLTLAQYRALLQTDKLVLVDVHSQYCGGCKKLLPTVDSVAQENAGVLKVVKIELFDNKPLGKELNIQSLPTLLLYRGGQLVWQQSGVTPKATLDKVIQAQAIRGAK